MERTPLLTFVIPISNYHVEIAERAIASVLAQTLTCNVIAVYDTYCKGAGAARNIGLAQVQSDFVSFLDADDEIAPEFAEKMLRAYDGRRYVFCDWITDHLVEAPECPWRGDGSSHVITTLLPTAWVRHIGGFDEALRGAEDTLFHWQLTRAGLCGKRLPEALFTYHDGGLRSKAWQADPDYQATMQAMIAPYGGLPMACCNDSVTRDEFAPGEAQPGDVQANWLQQGPRQMTGRATGRLYARVGNSRLVWVNPADIDAAPQLLSYVVEMPAMPSGDDFRRFAPQAMAKLVGKPPRTQQPASTPLPMPSADRPRGDEAASAGNVLRLYQQH